MRIDLFHDTACPWCRIGRQNLKAALTQWDGPPVGVHHRAFLLNPDIPLEGYRFQDYMYAKGGGQVPLEDWFAAPREIGRRASLMFNFERIERAPNTVRAHQLIALAPDSRREAVIDSVYAAYFEHGRDIGNLDVLVDIASSCGMDDEAVRSALERDALHSAVSADLSLAASIGVRGVPFFIVNGWLAFSGAQPPETILRVMFQAAGAVPQEDER